MDCKRIVLLAGHYGSGKTNIAVNLAMELKREGKSVVIADLDIVNPYYRTKDSQEELAAAGIPLISSAYANSNVDCPALPQEIYSIFANKENYAILDIGGDDRGAYALGRYTPFILEENNYEMLFVLNQFRPLTRTVEDTIEVMREIEAAAGIRFTAIVNNSNLGVETTADDVVGTAAFAEAVGNAAGIPIRFTTVWESIYEGVSAQMEQVVPLHLQDKRLWRS